ncbi:YbfB/YjiJ family MFS transporter, partial [Pseudomonadales bacterium]|nr:YbfB/YjiJ family MFS transporter [Pseudomonadales bacterium]
MSGPGSPPKEGRFRVNGWVVVTLIALSATVGHAFGRFSFGVLLPAVRDDLGISNTLAGFIGGTNVGFYLIGTLLVSWMAGRYRLLGIMRLGLVLAVLGLFTASLSTSPWALAAALAI